MVIEPGVEVNPVEDLSPPEADAGHVELSQERDPDPQIHRCLFSGQAADDRQRQVRIVHHSSFKPRLARK